MIDNNKQLKDEIFDLFQENLVDVLQFDDQDLLYDLNDDIIDIIVYDNIFIKQYGSGFFDNVTLSRYITFSENVKKLDENEKNLVKKLLQLYRNLKFFPDSMKDIPVDDWEIVPIDKFVVKKHSELSGPPKTKGEKEIEKLRQEEGDYAENRVENNFTF